MTKTASIVEALSQAPELSSRAIAHACGCSRQLVDRVRSAHMATSQPRKGADGKTYRIRPRQSPVAKIVNGIDRFVQHNPQLTHEVIEQLQQWIMKSENYQSTDGRKLKRPIERLIEVYPQLPRIRSQAVEVLTGAGITSDADGFFDDDAVRQFAERKEAA